jgi:hypothetical protein
MQHYSDQGMARSHRLRMARCAAPQESASAPEPTAKGYSQQHPPIGGKRPAMSEAAKRLFEEAMRLPPEERSLLGRRLLESVAATTDGMDAAELAALEEALDESERQFAAGEGQDFFESIADLRARS